MAPGEDISMDERILIITDRKKDLELLREILEPQGFLVDCFGSLDEVRDGIFEDLYGAIVADYNLVGDAALDWISFLENKRSKSCFILYGERVRADKISEILQKGAYDFVPRNLLSERIHDTILGGLDNRKAFIAILKMIDEQKHVNETLEREKEALRLKNQELGFINRLSSEVAYDLNWDGILPRMLDSGLHAVLKPEVLGILYRIGSDWNLSVHASKGQINKETLRRLKKDLVGEYFSLAGEKISLRELSTQLYPADIRVSGSCPISFSKQWILPLILAGKPSGMLGIVPLNSAEFESGKHELLSTVSNILAMSLENAQEYHRLKEMTVTDSLTDIYNRNGFRDFIQRELQRAQRYNKSLSVVMIDLDGFKAINDSFGHQAGDYVLRAVATCLKNSVRKSDIVARYGGDEFAILLPETDLEEAEVLMGRVVGNLQNHQFEWERKSMKVEISYGASTTKELRKGEMEKELIQRADSRLYAAKHARGLPYQLSKEA